MSKLGDTLRAAAEAADSAERYADNHEYSVGKLLLARDFLDVGATLLHRELEAKSREIG
jgi:hypothetical protein